MKIVMRDSQDRWGNSIQSEDLPATLKVMKLEREMEFVGSWEDATYGTIRLSSGVTIAFTFPAHAFRGSRAKAMKITTESYSFSRRLTRSVSIKDGEFDEKLFKEKLAEVESAEQNAQKAWKATQQSYQDKEKKTAEVIALIQSLCPELPLFGSSFVDSGIRVGVSGENVSIHIDTESVNMVRKILDLVLAEKEGSR